MRNVLICFALIVAGITVMAGARAENVIYGNSSTGPQPFNVNTSGQASITLLSGEDQTNSVFKVEHQYSYKAGLVADGAVKASAGFLHSVTCAGNDAAATAGDMTIRDATSAGAGTVVQALNFQAAWLQPFTVIVDASFATGIYFDFTTTADVMCSASYR